MNKLQTLNRRMLTLEQAGQLCEEEYATYKGLLDVVELVALTACMETEEEINERTDYEGMSGDDACETLSNLIDSARKLMKELNASPSTL